MTFYEKFSESDPSADYHSIDSYVIVFDTNGLGAESQMWTQNAQSLFRKEISEEIKRMLGASTVELYGVGQAAKYEFFGEGDNAPIPHDRPGRIKRKAVSLRVSGPTRVIQNSSGPVAKVQPKGAGRQQQQQQQQHSPVNPPAQIR